VSFSPRYEHLRAQPTKKRVQAMRVENRRVEHLRAQLPKILRQACLAGEHSQGPTHSHTQTHTHTTRTHTPTQTIKHTRTLFSLSLILNITPPLPSLPLSLSLSHTHTHTQMHTSITRGTNSDFNLSSSLARDEGFCSNRSECSPVCVSPGNARSLPLAESMTDFSIFKYLKIQIRAAGTWHMNCLNFQAYPSNNLKPFNPSIRGRRHASKRLSWRSWPIFRRI
jgi:hypothetical protein